MVKFLYYLKDNEVSIYNEYIDTIPLNVLLQFTNPIYYINKPQQSNIFLTVIINCMSQNIKIKKPEKYALCESLIRLFLLRNNISRAYLSICFNNNKFLKTIFNNYFDSSIKENNISTNFLDIIREKFNLYLISKSDSENINIIDLANKNDSDFIKLATANLATIHNTYEHPFYRVDDIIIL
jgi:hypothetical protein